jgi:hypothetical protein
VIIAASTQTLDRFASHGIVARQPPPPEEMWLLMIDIRLWLLSVFRPDFDPLDAVNLWGRLGFLQILMDFNGSSCCWSFFLSNWILFEYNCIKLLLLSMFFF